MKTERNKVLCRFHTEDRNIADNGCTMLGNGAVCNAEKCSFYQTQDELEDSLYRAYDRAQNKAAWLAEQPKWARSLVENALRRTMRVTPRT